MGAILPLITQTALDDAWDAYQRLAAEVVVNPLLFVDREHAEARIRAFRKFEHLFLIGDKS